MTKYTQHEIINEMLNTTGSILKDAMEVVHSKRARVRVSPGESFSKTAKIWSGILGTNVTPEQVALCMIGIKLAREASKPDRDNLVDIAGYAEALEMMHTERRMMDNGPENTE